MTKNSQKVGEQGIGIIIITTVLNINIRQIWFDYIY